MADEHEEVRRALAGARHTGPVPDEVLARLEATLERLAAEEPPGASTRVAGPVNDSVDDPVSRSVSSGGTVVRPPRWRRGLVAVAAVAAGVAVGGIVLGQLQPSGEDHATRALDSARSEAGPESAGQAADAEPSGPSPDRSTLHHDEQLDSGSALSHWQAPRVRSDHLRRDVRRALHDASHAHATTTRACGVDLPGQPHPVLLDGEEAVLLVRGTGARREVLVLECDDPAPRYRLRLR